MKARVYGWAVKLMNNNIPDKSFYFDGEIKEVEESENDMFSFYNKSSTNKSSCGFVESCYLFVHKKQIEPIKEITITEEEFDKACNKAIGMSMQISKDAFVNLLKAELFKDIR